MNLLSRLRIAVAKFLVLYRSWPSRRSFFFFDEEQSRAAELVCAALAPLFRVERTVRKAPVVLEAPTAPDTEGFGVADFIPRLVKVVGNGRIVRISDQTFSMDFVFGRGKRPSLRACRVVWPRCVRCASPRGIVAAVQAVVRDSARPIRDAIGVLRRVYMLGSYLGVVKVLEKCADRIGFSICRSGLEVLISFGTEFGLTIAGGGIFLVAKEVLFLPHKGVVRSGKPGLQAPRLVSFEVLLEDPVVAVCRARRSVFYSKLARVWASVAAAVNRLRGSPMRAEFRCSRIDLFAYESLIGVIVINPHSGQIEIGNMRGFGFPADLLLGALDADRVSFQGILRCALGKLIYLAATNRCWETSGATPAAVRFSFAPTFVLRFCENGAAVHISFGCPADSQPLTTTDILLREASSMPIAQTVFETVACARAGIALLRLDQKLRAQGISRVVGQNRIHFAFPPFEGVDFRVRPHSGWRLSLITSTSCGMPPVTLLGRFYSARVVDCLLRLVFLFRDFWQMAQQTVTKQIVLDDPSQLAFSCRVSRLCPVTVAVALAPMPPRSHCSYETLPGSVPRFAFCFGHRAAIGRMVEHSLRETAHLPHFGAFLNALFVPFYHLYSVFVDGNRDWSLTGTRLDRSFLLVHQNSRSLNVYLDPSQSFHFVCPSVGESTILVVALHEIMGPRRPGRVNHLTFQLPLDDLRRMKAVVEFFFAAKDGVEAIGFGNSNIADGHYYSSFSRPKAPVSIECDLCGATLVFSLTGDPGAAVEVDRVLNGYWCGLQARLLGVRIAVAVMEGEMSFFTIVIQFLGAVAAISEAIGVDLTVALTETVARSSKSRVIFHLPFVNGGNARADLRQRHGTAVIDVRAHNSTGSISRPKGIKALVEWLHSLIGP
jgi:hypothetical protein